MEILAADTNPTRIISYKRKWNINIGVILFGVIFIYLLITVISYITASHVSVYEVRKGTILKDTAYTGFIIREETVVYTDAGGYINFYVSDKEKVGVGANVFAISSGKIEDGVEEAEEKALTTAEQNSILIKTQQFVENYNGGSFTDVYTLKSDLETVLLSNESQNRVAHLDAMDPAGLTIYPASVDGVISYTTDGYEGTTIDKVTAEELHKKTEYNQVESGNNTEVKSGDPAYKLVTSETWSVVIELSDDTAAELAEKTQIKVNVPKGNQTLWAKLSITSENDANYAYLTFEKSMVQYIGDRYLDLELIQDDQSGLKIPKTAKVIKSFFVVPETYLTQGGNSKETGVLIKDKDDTSTTFTAAEIYYRDEEEGLVYLDPEEFTSQMVLAKPDSAETLTLEEKRSLDGVYNINKGYAVFKQIEILSESDEYYIVREGNSYSLSNYDHIALDGSSLREHDVVY